MSGYYDKQGKPIDDLWEWSKLFSDWEYKRIAETQADASWVSTVWLGSNHEWDPRKPPLIFETMVLGGELGEECERYSTEAEAVAGHAAMVARVYALRATQIQA